ncbi:MAG: GtrA family protein, partial [Alphaproteobacteria bacterium]|nr:GtrA family protein [Alphaproteobacteria bacterium]
GLTALVAVLYTAQVYLLRVQPNLATTIAIIIATFPGYFLHSHFSFAGHGARDAHTAHIRTLRFAVTSLVGFASNNLGTWTLVSLLHEPKWTPNLFFLFVTPVVTFALNRKWVFA